MNTNLTVLDIQYAHLRQISVSVGMDVNAGDHIGSFGKGGNDKFFAHLHLETRRETLSATAPQGSTTEDLISTRFSTIDPKLILANIPLGDFPTMVPTGRREIIGRGFFNDLQHPGNSIIVNRIGDKVYLKIS